MYYVLELIGLLAIFLVVLRYVNNAAIKSIDIANGVISDLEFAESRVVLLEKVNYKICKTNHELSKKCKSLSKTNARLKSNIANLNKKMVGSKHDK